MVLFARSSEGKRPLFLVDIGSGSVATAIVTPGHDGPARVHLYQRLALKQAETPRTTEQTKNALAELITQSAQETLTAFAQRNKAGAIQECVVLLHAPWTTSKTGTAAEKYDTETVITESMVGALAKQAISGIQSQSEETSPFEKAAVRVEVNGYPTTAPEEKRGFSLRVSALQSAADPAFLEKVRSAVIAALPGRKVLSHSATFALISTLEPMARNVSRYTLVDITSEATHILMMGEGELEGEAVAPVGWRTLVRELAKKYGTGPDEALSRFRMAIAESCTDESCSQVIASLGDIAPVFIAPYGNVLTELSKDLKVPATAVLLAPPDISQWFIDLLSKLDFAPFTDTGQPFNVQQLLPRHLAEKVIFEPGLVPEAGIAAASLFVHSRAQHAA